MVYLKNHFFSSKEHHKHQVAPTIPASNHQKPQHNKRQSISSRRNASKPPGQSSRTARKSLTDASGRKKRSPKRRRPNRLDLQGHKYKMFNIYSNADYGFDQNDKPVQVEEKKVRRSFKFPIYAGLYYGNTPNGPRDSGSIDVDSLDSDDSATKKLRRFNYERLTQLTARKRLRSSSLSSEDSSGGNRMIRRVASSEIARLGYIRRGFIGDLDEAWYRVKMELHKRFRKAEALAEERRACRDLACYEPNTRKLDPFNLPVGDRLTVRRRNSLTIWRQQLPPPDEAIPDPSLPEWTLLQLDQKIPQVPAPRGLLYFHRGPPGHQLHIKTPNFTLADPNNQERVVAEPYNSLHDPHLADYFAKPSVQRLLLERGFINHKGQVLCTAKQFNKYRMYLRTVYNISLDHIMDQREKQEKYDFITSRKINSHISKVDADEVRAKREKRRRQAIAANEARRAENLQKYEMRRQQAIDRYACHLIDKLRERVNNVLKAAAKAEAHKQRLFRVEQNRKIRAQRIKLETLAKHAAAQERLENSRDDKLEATEVEIADRLALKYDYQEDRLQKQDIIIEALKELQHERALKWQAKMEKARLMMAEKLRLRQEREEYLMGLARKYFNLWRQKVLARRAAIPDAMHASAWDITRVLTKMNEDIAQRSGVKRDLGRGLLMGIMKLSHKKAHFEDDNDEEGDIKDDHKGHDDEAADEALIAKTLENYVKKESVKGDSSSDEDIRKSIIYTPDEASRSSLDGGHHHHHRASTKRKSFGISMHSGGRTISSYYAKRANKSLYKARKKSKRWVHAGAPSRMMSKTKQRYVAKTTSGKFDVPKSNPSRTQLSNTKPNCEKKIFRRGDN